MKPLRAVLAALVALSVLGLDASVRRPVRAGEVVRSASVRPAAPDAPRVVPGQVIVQFRTGTDLRDVARAVRDAGGARVRTGVFGGRYLVSLDAGFTIPEALRRLRSDPVVEYAEPNGVVRALLRPNDTRFDLQWNFQMLNVERMWDIQTGDASVAVAVIDTGVAYEDFGPYRKAPDWGDTVFLPGFDFVNGDDHPNDDNFHGTHVASTIAEATNNGLDAAGLAFRCAIMPVKVLDHEGSGAFFDVAEGIDFAARDSRVKVINLSLGGEGPDRAVQDAVDRAVGRGITVVAAAGNDGQLGVLFPASLPNVIAVGAVDGRKIRASYSNFGPEISVVAPGGDLDRDDTGPNLSPDGRPDGILQQTFDPDSAERGIYDDFDLFFVSGTSQATPHVAALAALLYRQGITSPAAIRAAIESTASDLGPTGRDDEYGHGLIQPVAALKGLGLGH